MTKPVKFHGGHIKPSIVVGAPDMPGWQEAGDAESQYGMPQTSDSPPKTVAQKLGVPWWFWVLVAYGLYKSNSRK